MRLFRAVAAVCLYLPAITHIPCHTFSKIKTAVAMSPENHDPAFRAFGFPASGTFLLVRITLDNFRAISLWTVNCERSTANLYPRSSPRGFS